MRSDETPLDILRSLPTPRVWSMLVTIFGDLAQAREDRIDGPLLTRLTDGMGIRPEAVRVALHRLRNEDWITSEKAGRTSSHALTAKGRQESEAATRLIYAAPEELPADWQMVLAEANDPELRAAMEAAGLVQVTARVFVGPAGGPPPGDSLAVIGGAAPDWLREQILPPEHTAEFADLLAILRQVSAAMERSAPGAPLSVALLRCLLVHHWRRLVLRHPYLPPSLTGQDWPGQVCRAEMARLLARLPRADLRELRAEPGGLSG